MFRDLKLSERVAQSSERSFFTARIVFSTPEGLAFLLKPFETKGVLGTGIIIALVNSLTMYGLIRSGGLDMLPFLYLSNGIAIILSLFVLFLILSEKLRGSISVGANDQLFLYRTVDQTVVYQKGKIKEQLLGTWDSLPLQFSLTQKKMGPRSGGRYPFWSVECPHLDQETGKFFMLFGTFVQSNIQSIRDAAKQHNITLIVNGNDAG